MRKEEKTLKEFLESIPILEKSELGVLRGGFGAISSGTVSPLTNKDCNNKCVFNRVCPPDNDGCNDGCTKNDVCGCPYNPSMDPSIADYSLSLSFL